MRRRRTFWVWLMSAVHANESIRYEPDEQPPPPLAIGAGFQAALIMLAPVILGVVIVLQIAGQPAEYTAWAVFAALLVSGATTILQAVRFRRIGSGHVLFMGTSGAFIAVCIGALVTGRSGHDGEPDRYLVAVSVPAGRAAGAAARHLHADGHWHGNYVDRRHGSTAALR